MPADCTVGVAQVVECQTVDLVVVGSNPITHPEPESYNRYAGVGSVPCERP